MSAQCGYGYFPGGDPRDFHPDPECSTDAERAAHATDCAAWDAWQAAGRVGDPPAPSVRYGHEHFSDGEVSGWVTFSGYGLGGYTYEDDEPEPPPCDSSPTCPCPACEYDRMEAEMDALARHRDATSSATPETPDAP